MVSSDTVRLSVVVPTGIRLVFENAHVLLAGSPEHVKPLIVPLNPFIAVAVRVIVAVLPRVTVKVVGAAPRLKSGLVVSAGGTSAATPFARFLLPAVRS